ncbi:MAG: hypothetical protein KGL04_03135 [Elusimicrobia bacterium]|nr:hypothetical protein [Elusimicrobiota bacterium]
MKTRAALLAAAALAAGACVPYPQGGPAGTDESAAGPAVTQASFAPLDAGASQVDSLHFSVHAYGDQAANQISQAAETDYNNVMMDTNLYSFMPQSGLYQVYVYADQAEYIKKTGQPEWSGGVAYGNAIYTYMGPQLYPILAHEMTHVIFYDYMRYPGGDINPQHRWVNEGLAVYEEEKAASGGQGIVDLFPSVRPDMIQNPIPMDQMISLAPATEQAHTVSVWYCEAESLVQFMIEHGGRMGFSQFLAALKKGETLDQAVASGFPGTWSGLAPLYVAWKTSLL